MYGPRFCIGTDLLLEDVRTPKLRRRLGDASVFHLLKLWTWAVRFRPDGALTELDEEDIEQIAEWRERMTGKEIGGNQLGAFVKTMIEVGFLEQGQSGEFSLPDLDNGNVIVEKS